MERSSFQANSNHIARFECKPYPEPLPANAVTLGSEKYAFDKIVGELRSDNPVVKSKAVVAARELLVTPTKHIQCIAAGITPALIDLLKEPDESLQAEAATTLHLLAVREVGCRDVLQHGGLQQLLQLLKQQSCAVKDAVYGTLCAAAKSESFRAAIVRQEGALGQLVTHAQQEEPQRAAQALDLLLHCSQMRHNQDALSNLIAVVQAAPKLAAMISSSTTTELVRLKSTKLLAVLASTRDDARKQAVECGCMPELLKLLACGSDDLVSAAAEALMMITLAREGKVALHEANGTTVLVDVLMSWMMEQQQAKGTEATIDPSTKEQCIVNVLQTVTNAAEYPPCRESLQQLQAGNLLQNMQRQFQEGPSPSELVRQAASQALRLIGFHNWPQ